jgi:hypothetical protein
MTLKMKFTVIARCKVYEEDGFEELCTEDLELTFNKDQAMGVFFRFVPSYFMLEDYKVCVKYDDLADMKNTVIMLVKDGKKYIVTNISQFISEVHEGYFRLLSLDKFSSIMEYDFGDVDAKDEFGEF